jgi:dTDP-glucose pyrophosphorylase
MTGDAGVARSRAQRRRCLLRGAAGHEDRCLEEIAYRGGFIDRARMLALAAQLQKSGYGDYLRRLVEQE